MKLKKSLSANKLIGVQEINQFIKENISLDECKELINIKTRQYAKRQNTWARGTYEELEQAIFKKFLNSFKKIIKSHQLKLDASISRLDCMNAKIIEWSGNSF